MTTALGIGFCQCVAMIPGVSRAGATILGAELLGVDRGSRPSSRSTSRSRPCSARPCLDLWKTRAALTESGIGLIAIGS